MRAYLSFSLSIAFVAGCGPSRVYDRVISGVGDPCKIEEECRRPLICDTSTLTCQPSHAIDRDEWCILDADCRPGLYCNQESCEVAGAGEVGDVCASSADCESELYCAFEGFGGTCRQGGAADLDEGCTSRGDCMAGMMCDLRTRTCAGNVTKAGDSCTSDDECAPADYVYCIAGKCAGRGPDSAPVPVWSGARCPGNEQEGAFQVLFDIRRTGGDDFFALPFPNDALVSAGGDIDMTGFPLPPAATVPTPMVERYIQAIQRDQDGFGPNQSVFLRFSRKPLFCPDGCDPCPAGCMGPGEPARSVYVVDLTTGQFGTENWYAYTGDDPYICGTWLANRAWPHSPWVAGHTYAVFIHSDIRGATNNQAMQQDPDFTVMLADSEPSDGALRAAWRAYAPLRDWLSTSPQDGSRDETFTTEHIGGAAVFTIREPAALMTALGDAVESAAAPVLEGSAVHCDATGAAQEGCADTGSSSFTEVQGHLRLSSFQYGVSPYADSGGRVTTESSPISEAVRFSLTIPAGSAPAAGWPVVIYAHGTGGDYQSHLRDGVAEQFAEGTRKAAVLGIDQVVHGERAADSTLDPDLLFFNLGNPDAARGNVLQAAADQLSLLRAIPALSAEVDRLLPGTTLDRTRLFFLGHSQGAVAGVAAMARAGARMPAAFAGVGGGTIDLFLNRTSPYDLGRVMPLVMGEHRTLSDARAHPVLSLMQGFLEEADPINYGRHVAIHPLAGSVSKHLLHIVGIGDTYATNDTSLSLSRRLAPVESLRRDAGTGARVNGIYLLDDGAVGFGNPSATAPVVANFLSSTAEQITAAVSVHVPAGGQDGHFVLFDDPEAMQRVVQMASSWFADPTVPPTIP